MPKSIYIFLLGLGGVTIFLAANFVDSYFLAGVFENFSYPVVRVQNLNESKYFANSYVSAKGAVAVSRNNPLALIELDHSFISNPISKATALISQVLGQMPVTYTLAMSRSDSGVNSNPSSLAAVFRVFSPFMPKINLWTNSDVEIKKNQLALFHTGPVQTLQVTVTGSGSVTGAGINCLAGAGDCSEGYPQQSVVKLTAVLTGSSTAVAWQGCSVDPSDYFSCFVIMETNRSVAARFYQPSVATPAFTLNLTKSGSDADTVSGSGGIYCGSGCSSLVKNYSVNTDLTLTAAAGAGSSFTGWSLTGGTAGDACSGTGNCFIKFVCPAS
jgi:hypothetical protein